MLVKTIWVMRDRGELELLDAWDINTYEENPDGYAEKLAEFRKDKSCEVREIHVSVSEASIRNAFKLPLVDADVVGPRSTGS
jgi:hypothetical protein